MEEVKIDLLNVYENLKAFYYQNGNGSIFTCKDTKIPIFEAVICLLVTIVLYFITLSSPQAGWIFLTAIFSIASCVVVIDTVKSCGQYLKWKHSVESSLNKIKNYKIQQLRLTQSAIEISNADETTIENWDSIEHATIKADSVYLRNKAKAFYIFPAKSMKPEEFIVLTNFIRNKIEQK
jgi:hypothetical protein